MGFLSERYVLFEGTETKVQQITIVIPTKNEYQAIKIFKTAFVKIHTEYETLENMDIRVLVVDDTKNNSVKDVVLSGIDYGMRYRKGNGNYGDSLTTGMIMGGAYDKLIIMDVDHPTNAIIRMINELDTCDVVIGHDLNQGFTRHITNWFCNTFLRLGLNHPTCGLIGFNSYVTRLADERNISFWLAQSKRDIIHVEWIKESRNKNLDIREIKFNTSRSTIKHDYTIKRCIKWLISFFMTWIRTMMGMYP